MYRFHGFLCAVMGLLFVGSAIATDVSGTITTTTWTAANSPYRVTGAVTVPVANTLTIEAGVDVLFDATVPFTIEGAIQALGTAAERISFAEGATGWNGLRVSGATSDLQHVDMSGVVGTGNLDPTAATEVRKLLASDAGASAFFGFNVAVDGDVMVITAFRESSGGTDAGAAYVFQRNQGGADNWGEVRKLVASDAQSGDYFGYSVAVDGDVVVIGASSEDARGSSAGAVYIFLRNQGGIDNWGEFKKITASDAQSGDSFGISVAMNGDEMFVGAYGRNTADSSNAGAVYMFQQDMGGINNWGEVKKIIPDSPQNSGDFGWSVALDGDVLVVGARNEDADTTDAGTACVYQRDEGGVNNWGLVKKLISVDPERGGQFGIAVAVDGDIVVVGARSEDIGEGDNAGAVYVYQRDRDGINNWGLAKKLISDGPTDYDYFGNDVSVDGDMIVVGEFYGGVGGIAHIFQRDNGGISNWGHVTGMTASDAQSSDGFGHSVLVSGDLVVVGAYAEDSGGAEAGATYIINVPLDAGSAVKVNGATLDITGALIIDNESGILASDGASVTLTNSTVASNAGPVVEALSTASVIISNSIIWDNATGLVEDGGTITATYSCVQDMVWPGTGNISSDPLFVDAANGDYHLTALSPCIGTASDGGDMGAFAYVPPPPHFSIPDTTVPLGQSVMVIPVVAELDGVPDVEIVFVFDPAAIDTTSPFLMYNHFDSLGWFWSINVVADTVRFAAATGSDTLHNFIGDVLRFAFDVSGLPPTSSTELQFVPGDCWVNGMPANTQNGWLTNDRPWGDASSDGVVTAFDASLILQYVVELPVTIDWLASDVTGSGRVSAHDAGLVLTKVLNPAFMFPVEGGGGGKLATGNPRTVSLMRDATGWLVNVDDATGIMSGEMTFALPEGAVASATGGAMIASDVADGILTVAFIRDPNESALFHVETDGTPMVTGAEFNEGSILVAGGAPTTLSLAQNTPNPFNPTTSIRYSLAADGVVSLCIYNALGQRVHTLVNGPSTAGYHSVTWNGTDGRGRAVASGVYLYRLVTGNNVMVKRMVLVR
jgi:hypothetical protein